MKVGDYVVKAEGASKGETGLVMSIKKGGPGNILVEVLTGRGELIVWPGTYVVLLNKGEEKDGTNSD